MKYVRGLAAAMVMASTVLVGAGSSAVQAATINGCTAPSYFCAFAQLSYGTGDGWGQWYGDSGDWSSSIDNEDSSVVNTSFGYRVRVYQNTGYSGGVIYCVPINVSIPSLSNQFGVYDQGDSHTWNSSC